MDIFEKILKKTEVEETEPSPEEFIEPKEEELSLEEKVFNFLKKEFENIEISEKLQIAGPTAPPLCILRTENQVLSCWYRLPIKGESSIIHIPDFVAFKGSFRSPPRGKNPDLVIECRELSEDLSNRTDPRVVKDLIGESLDVLPANTILVSNRALSEYAYGLAKSYGIGTVMMGGEDKSSYYEFAKLITNEEDVTRLEIFNKLGKCLQKLETFKRLKKKTAVTKEEVKRGNLREKIIKALNSKPGSSTAQIASMLKAHDNYVLNELYKLEREGKVRIARKSKKVEDFARYEWALRGS